MEHGGYYPINPASSTQNVPYPPYWADRVLDPYGIIPEGYPFFDPVSGAPGTEFEADLPEKWVDNPCSCCCDLVTAAKALTVLNLFYLPLQIIGMFAPDTMLSPWGLMWDFCFGFMNEVPDPKRYEDVHLFYVCEDHQAHIKDWCYIVILTMFIFSILAYFLVTICFMADVFGGPNDPVWSNIYMWSSFWLPGASRVFLLVHILTLRDHGQCVILYSKCIASTVSIVVLAVFNGLIARGYRKMIVEEEEDDVDLVPQGLILH